MWVGIPLFDLLGMLVFIPLLGRVVKREYHLRVVKREYLLWAKQLLTTKLRDKLLSKPAKQRILRECFQLTKRILDKWASGQDTTTGTY